jgi:transposase
MGRVPHRPGRRPIGELPAVRVPTQAEEAARDLVRAREDARADLMRVRHRLSKLLLRQGLLWPGAAWTQAHDTGCTSCTAGWLPARTWRATRPSARCCGCARRERCEPPTTRSVAW